MLICRGRWFDRNGASVGTLANESVYEEGPVRVGETGRRLAVAERDPKAAANILLSVLPPSSRSRFMIANERQASPNRVYRKGSGQGSKHTVLRAMILDLTPCRLILGPIA